MTDELRKTQSTAKRLPSFRAARDLSLGSGDAGRGLTVSEKQRKVFTPNVNVERKKNRDIAVPKDSQTDIYQRQTKGSLHRPRSTRSLVQADARGSLFAEGAAITKPSYGSRSSKNPASRLERPVLKLKEVSQSKEEEEAALASLFRDDFVKDPDLIPDSRFAPLTLPLYKYSERKGAKSAKARREKKVAERIKAAKAAKAAEAAQIAKDEEDAKNAEDASDANIAEDGFGAMDGKDAKKVKGAKDTEQTEEIKDVKDAVDQKVAGKAKDAMDTRDTKEANDAKEDTKDVKDAIDTKVVGDAMDVKDAKGITSAVEFIDVKVAKDAMDAGDARSSMEVMDVKDSVDKKGNEKPKDTKAFKDAKDQRNAKNLMNTKDIKGPLDTVKALKALNAMFVSDADEIEVDIPAEAKEKAEEQNDLVYSIIFDHKKRQQLLLQLPDRLPCLPASKSEEVQTSKLKSSQPGSSGETSKEEPQHCALKDLAPGLIGELLVRKSGKVELTLGHFRLNVKPGTFVGFKQDLVATQLNPATLGGNAYNLGPVNDRLICTPAWDTLMKKKVSGVTLE